MELTEEEKKLVDMGFFIWKDWSEYRRHEEGSAYYWNKSPREHQKRRLRRIKENGGSHKPEEIWGMYSRQNGRCNYCAIELYEKFEKDHIIPISRGGRNDINNIQILCKQCNRKKGTMTHEEYARKI